MTTDLIDGTEQLFLERQRVLGEYVKGKNPTAISRELGLRRVDVTAHIDAFNQSMRGQEIIRDIAEELIGKSVEHTARLTQKAHEVIDWVDGMGQPSHQEIGQKIKAIALAADLQRQQIDTLQKAGLLDAADMGDQMAEMEADLEMVLGILAQDLCRSCTAIVKRKIAEHKGTKTAMPGTVVVMDE